MTEPQPGNRSPHIHIIQGADGVVIKQHRPAVLPSLTDLPVDEALKLVPNLLPICGMAQSVAAARAVEAALGCEADEQLRDRREQQLRREQALSAGWRLGVDWPDLLGEPRAMVWLKVLRSCESDDDLAAVLSNALPGLDSVSSPDELTAWTRTGDSNAAAVIRRALDETGASAVPDVDGHGLSASRLADVARASLGSNGFNPLDPMLECGEVGPLATARDSLIAEIREQFGTCTTARLLALLADTRSIARRLVGELTPDTGEADAWQEDDLCGTGRATTARGPVFHRVELDGNGRVVRWLALAPTDWHFAPRGPVAQALSECDSSERARLTVASFDPCAPWTLQYDGAV